MSTTRNNRYQEGSINRVKRAKGPDVWVYRWRELQEDGRRVQRKTTIGDAERYPNKSDVKREVEKPPCGDQRAAGESREEDSR